MDRATFPITYPNRFGYLYAYMAVHRVWPVSHTVAHKVFLPLGERPQGLWLSRIEKVSSDKILITSPAQVNSP